MASPDTSIILNNQTQYDPVGNLLKGYQAGNQVNKALAESQVQQQLVDTDLQQRQANLQNTQLGNQSQDLQNQAAQRQNAYQIFARNYKLPMKEDGTIDTQRLITDHIEAGFPDQALRETEELTKHQLGTTKSLTERAQVVTNSLGALSNGINMLPPEQQAPAKEAVRQSFITTTGIDPLKAYGQNWYDQVRNTQLSPDQQLERMKIGADYQGMNPDSEKSKMMRQALQSQGVQVPENVSAFDLVTRPEFKNVQDQLPQGVKISILQDAQTKQQSLDAVDASLRRIEKNASLLEKIRPFETIRAFLDKLGNTPEGAEINQLVADLEAHGVKIDNKTSLAGARDRLEFLRSQMKTQIQRAQESMGSNSISQTGKTLSSPTVSPEQKKLSSPAQIYKYIDLATGKTFNVSAEQAQRIKGNARFKLVK